MVAKFEERKNIIRFLEKLDAKKICEKDPKTFLL